LLLFTIENITKHGQNIHFVGQVLRAVGVNKTHNLS